MDTLYNPHGVEERWQRTWEEEGLYNAEPDPAREPFVDAHPPPNVTGELHMGHALQLALGDAVIRMKRMQGYNVLFQPGYDHAGISTQNAVEKQLAREGTSRQELGRDAFERAHLGVARGVRRQDHAPVPAHGRLARLPARALHDGPGYVRAVMRFFVHLYEQGLDLPRQPDHQLVPVPPDRRSPTSSSSHAEVDDTLSTIRYPLADGSGHIAIATVRPATIPPTSRSPCTPTTSATAT